VEARGSSLHAPRIALVVIRHRGVHDAEDVPHARDSLVLTRLVEGRGCALDARLEVSGESTDRGARLRLDLRALG
jgi:hypothetical protein